jgi:hypothetical protein
MFTCPSDGYHGLTFDEFVQSVQRALWLDLPIPTQISTHLSCSCPNHSNNSYIHLKRTRGTREPRVVSGDITPGSSGIDPAAKQAQGNSGTGMYIWGLNHNPIGFL